MHVSKIIRAIAAEQGILKAEWVEELSLVEVPHDQSAWWNRLDAVARLRMSVGLAWEEWYLNQLPHVLKHPGEMQVDGVFMTHDGESLDVIVTERGTRGHILAVHEVKATWKSVNTVGDLSNQWMWLSQCKAYCKGLGARRAYLHPLFLCGDYSYPIRPRLGPVEGQETCFQIDFTQEEIDESWDLLIDYMRERLQRES